METEFEAPGLIDSLESHPLDGFDDLDFGLVVMDRSGIVLAYNRSESERSGLSPENVIGEHFFQSVGPCTNNYMVAQRYLDEPDLDAIVDYVFTFKMSPTPVKLRLLSRAGSDRQYLAVIDR